MEKTFQSLWKVLSIFPAGECSVSLANILKRYNQQGCDLSDKYYKFDHCWYPVIMHRISEARDKYVSRTIRYFKGPWQSVA